MLLPLLGALFLALPTYAVPPRGQAGFTEPVASSPDSSLPRGYAQVVDTPKHALAWGDVNFVHTTDIHGWLLGHPLRASPEPDYSGHIGDIHSFLEHMRARADREGRDLLLIDSGDHHDGTGLVSDGGDLADWFLSNLNYSVLGIGNHELYKEEDAREVALRVSQGRWGGRYLTANTNLTYEDGTSRPIGDRFAKFVTKQGRKVTAFGILYAFQASSKNVINQGPTILVTETWFLEAIQEKPDFFILAGHMPVRGDSSEWRLVFDTIRQVHADVPIFVFGGHSHIRDCVQMDERSMSLQSGRFLESIGWMSANLTEAPEPLRVSRRYLDQNRRSYEFHSGVSGPDFDTEDGMAIIQAVRDVAADMNISSVLGVSPQDYYLQRVPFKSPDSVLTKLMYDVLPTVVVDEAVDKSGRPKMFLANSGSHRGDVYKGPFTQDAQSVVCPFTTPFSWVVIKASMARRILQQMNDNGASQLMPMQPANSRTSGQIYDAWMRDQWEDYAGERAQTSSDGQMVFNAEPKSLGYVTKDSCAGQTDDIEHIPIPHANIPDYVGNEIPSDTPDDADVTLVAMDFFFGDCIKAARQIDPASTLDWDDLKPYAPGHQLNQVWGHYAAKAWAVEG